MQTLYFILNLLGILLFFGGAWMLRVGARNDRATRVLLFILLIWGTAYLSSLASQLTGNIVAFGPMSLKVLILGNLFVIVSMLYPIEAVRPGWLGIRSLLRLFLPYLAVVVLYFVILGIRGEPIRRLSSVADMLLNFDEFNVWYRFVFYLTSAFYIAYMLLSTSNTEYEYRKFRSCRNTASMPKTPPHLLRSYGIGMACITVVYLFVLLYGSTVSMLVHRGIVLAVFAFTIRKILSASRIAGTTP